MLPLPGQVTFFRFLCFSWPPGTEIALVQAHHTRLHTRGMGILLGDLGHYLLPG